MKEAETVRIEKCSREWRDGKSNQENFISPTVSQMQSVGCWRSLLRCLSQRYWLGFSHCVGTLALPRWHRVVIVTQPQSAEEGHAERRMIVISHNQDFMQVTETNSQYYNSAGF